MRIDVFLRKNVKSPRGIELAMTSDIMRNTAIVVLVGALFASTAAVSVRHQHRWTEKLDVELMQAAEQDSANSVKTVIHVRSGAADRVVSHLEQHGLKPARLAASDLVAVQLPGSMLRNVAGDSDVVRLSSDHGDGIAE